MLSVRDRTAMLLFSVFAMPHLVGAANENTEKIHTEAASLARLQEMGWAMGATIVVMSVVAILWVSALYRMMTAKGVPDKFPRKNN